MGKIRCDALPITIAIGATTYTLSFWGLLTAIVVEVTTDKSLALKWKQTLASTEKKKDLKNRSKQAPFIDGQWTLVGKSFEPKKWHKIKGATERDRGKTLKMCQVFYSFLFSLKSEYLNVAG